MTLAPALALADSSPSGWGVGESRAPSGLCQMRGSLRGWGLDPLSPVILDGIEESWCWQRLCSKDANSGCLLPFSSFKIALEEVQKGVQKGLVWGSEMWLQLIEAVGAGKPVLAEQSPPHHPQTQSPLPTSLTSAVPVCPPPSPFLSLELGGESFTGAPAVISFPLYSWHHHSSFSPPQGSSGSQENPSPHPQS